jgi:hypothetical protein
MTNINDVIMKKSWLIGFTEAEGSFSIVKKSTVRIAHAFEITQKRDPIVLQAVANLLFLGLVKRKKSGYYSVSTVQSQAISNIVQYFHQTIKGIKSLEYRIWARSFNKKNHDFDTLHKTQNIMRNIRSIRPFG